MSGKRSVPRTFEYPRHGTCSPYGLSPETLRSWRRRILPSSLFSQHLVQCLTHGKFSLNIVPWQWSCTWKTGNSENVTIIEQMPWTLHFVSRWVLETLYFRLWFCILIFIRLLCKNISIKNFWTSTMKKKDRVDGKSQQVRQRFISLIYNEPLSSK